MQFGRYSFEASNPDKVLFPKEGITKKALIDYYQAVSVDFLRHAKGHPLTMHRYPDGIDDVGFFQKEVPDYFPDWIDRVTVDKKSGGRVTMLLVRRKADLAYLANQGCITPHLWLSTASSPKCPDQLIFDLDPPDDGFGLVVKAAFLLKEYFKKNGDLNCFIKTTGSRGMHVSIPIKPDISFDRARAFAKSICKKIADDHADKFTIATRKDQRGGRLFLDYLRNSYGQHAVAPYAVRAIEKAPVATPLEWEEVENLENGAQTFNISNVPERLHDRGDPWKGIHHRAKSIKKLI